MSKWTVIDDTKLRHYWLCPECNVEEAYVEPWWYEDSGTPMCTECDEDMNYVRTEYNND
jgi:hypothetical protein